jgi:hypothetical protein
MRTLVIPDIHHRFVQAQLLIDTVPHDRVVLTGDYFDSFGDTPDHAYNTAVWLKEMVLTNPKITVLIGNHDQYYIWPWYGYLRGSGYTDMKSHAIRKVLNQDDFDKFKFFTVDQGFVLSHAGVTSQIWKEFLQCEADDFVTTTESFCKVMQERIDISRNMISVNRPAELFMAGWDRGGSVRHGGITWGDWSSFGPVKGINQIVGHTPHFIPEILTQSDKGSVKRYLVHQFVPEKVNMKKLTSINYALDTHSKHYAIIEDGKVDVYDATTHLTLIEMVKKNMPIIEEIAPPVVLHSAMTAMREQLMDKAGETGSTVTVPNMDDIDKEIERLKNGTSRWTQVEDKDLT